MDAPARASRPPREVSRWPVLPAAMGILAILLLAAVAMAASSGLGDLFEQRAAGTSRGPGLVTVNPGNPPIVSRPSSGIVRVDATQWVIGAVVLGLPLLAILLVRLLRALRQRAPDPVPPALSVAALLSRAAERASAALDDSGARSSDNAVIACWLALEEAAGHAGSPRPPALTPTEYTAGLLARYAPDRAATATLLDLYQRARFGSSPLPADATDRARAALNTIRARLRAAPTGAVR